MKATITGHGRVTAIKQKVLRNGRGVTNLIVACEYPGGDIVNFQVCGGGRLSETIAQADVGDLVEFSGLFEPIAAKEASSFGDPLYRFLNVFASELQIMIKAEPEDEQARYDERQVAKKEMPTFYDYDEDADFYRYDRRQ